mmetsp:Transcript_92518/g.178348  ORF Transcript_92518/g.178348 Transcript_92518/m.178348 type:complete len:475 (+) Transcript_92518:20-1444(+)
MAWSSHWLWAVMAADAGQLLRVATARCGREMFWNTSGVHDVNVIVDGIHRRFNVYEPASSFAFSMDPLPVLLLAPGSGNTPHSYLAWADVQKYAQEVPFYIVEINGQNNNLNVDLGLRPTPGRPNDVALAKTALQWVDQRLCIDRQRIYCAGMSRGGRFCCMLASGLPGILAAIAPVSGLRYPAQNQADRPTSIIALHGTADDVNPYEGGGPSYWGLDSVLAAARKWAVWSNCVSKLEYKLNDGVIITNFTGCSNGASVLLYSVLGAKHAGLYQTDLFGPKSVFLNATQAIWSFFWKHPLRGDSNEIWDAVMMPRLLPPSMPPDQLNASWLRAVHAFGIPTTTTAILKPRESLNGGTTTKTATPATPWQPQPLPLLTGLFGCASVVASAVLLLRQFGCLNMSRRRLFEACGLVNTVTEVSCGNERASGQRSPRLSFKDTIEQEHTAVSQQTLLDKPQSRRFLRSSRSPPGRRPR